MLNKIGENTDNIKYLGNTWQKSGSIENAVCMYTPEKLLNLFFRERSYLNGKIGYRMPLDGDEVSPAFLSHDLILVNLHFYVGSKTSSAHTINTLKDYLAYGIAISNPIYDPSFKIKYIPLLDRTTIANSTDTLSDFLSKFEVDENISIDKNSVVSYFRNRYDLSSANNINEQTSLSEFFNTLDDENKEKFLRDFSLPIHDPDAIKLPFYDQTLDNDVELEKSSNRIATRFVLNSVGTSDPSRLRSDFSYIDELSNAAEYVLTSSTNSGESYSVEFSSGETVNITPTTLENDISVNLDSNAVSFVTKILTSSEETSDFLSRNKVDLTTAASTLSQISQTSSGGFGSLLNPVYIGYDSSVQMYNNNAIQLCVPQDKATILINEEAYETWDIFGGLVLGYKLVDALIAQRTFIGSIWAWGTLGNISETLTSSDYKDIDLYKSIKKYPGQTGLTYNYSADSSYYITIQILNNLYTRYGPSGAAEEQGEILTTPVLEWISKESVIFKAPFFGDFIEEKNFQQDLTPESKVEFKEVLVDKERGGKGRFKDSITRVPYMEQTMPLVYKPEGIEIEDSKASTTFPGVSNIKDGDRGFSITPPFLADSEKGDESSLLDNEEVIKKTGAGSIRIEERIISKTIDELWTYIKKLSEDSNETALPKFYGIKAEGVGLDNIPTVRLNPNHNVVDTKYVDILSWEPKTYDNGPGEEGNGKYPARPYSNKNHRELDFKGWEVTDHIVKYLDYEVKPFSRDTEVDEIYQFRPNSKGYLTQLYNNIEVSLGMLQSNIDILNNEVISRTSTKFNSTLDESLKNNLTERTEKINQIRSLISSILNFNTYKEYLENPKNLKTIERDLEELKMNIKMLADYLVTSYVMKGALDRNTERGTLHTLHRNSFEFEDTLIPNQDAHINNITGDFEDNKVWFEDGESELRYVHPDNKYFFTQNNKNGAFGIKNIVKEETGYTRKIRGQVSENNFSLDREKINKAELHQIYLAADGTWRYIFDNLTIPIVDDEF